MGRKLYRRRRNGKIIRVVELIISILTNKAKILISKGIGEEIRDSIGKIKKSYINVIRVPLNSNPSKIGTRKTLGGLSIRVNVKTGKEYFKHGAPSEYINADGVLNYDKQGRLTKVF